MYKDLYKKANESITPSPEILKRVFSKKKKRPNPIFLITFITAFIGLIAYPFLSADNTSEENKLTVITNDIGTVFYGVSADASLNQTKNARAEKAIENFKYLISDEYIPLQSRDYYSEFKLKYSDVR